MKRWAWVAILVVFGLLVFTSATAFEATKAYKVRFIMRCLNNPYTSIGEAQRSVFVRIAANEVAMENTKQAKSGNDRLTPAFSRVFNLTLQARKMRSMTAFAALLIFVNLIMLSRKMLYIIAKFSYIIIRQTVTFVLFRIGTNNRLDWRLPSRRSSAFSRSLPACSANRHSSLWPSISASSLLRQWETV